MEALYAFKGLDAEYDLRGNWLMGRGQQMMGELVRCLGK